MVHAEGLSYVSHLTDAETFGRLALVKTHRRGTETAKTVWAVNDGAECIPRCVDCHWPDAVRLLDVPHALESVAHAGQAADGEGTAAFTRWFAIRRQTLHAGNPTVVWEALRPLAIWAKRRRVRAALPPIQANLNYLEKRRGMLDHAWYQARGYAIGHGSIESANKLVVERRLKGTGMPRAGPMAIR